MEEIKNALFEIESNMNMIFNKRSRPYMFVIFRGDQYGFDPSYSETVTRHVYHDDSRLYCLENDPDENLARLIVWRIFKPQSIVSDSALTYTDIKAAGVNLGYLTPEILIKAMLSCAS